MVACLIVDAIGELAMLMTSSTPSTTALRLGDYWMRDTKGIRGDETRDEEVMRLRR